MAHAARAASEIDLAREELSSDSSQKSGSPLRFLSVRLGRLTKGTTAARDARESQGQLELFRKRLRSIEESLHLRVPPADLIQQAEILLDSARNEGEKSEATNLLRECQERMARHLLDTASEFLQAGEKDVAIGLLHRALTLGSRESDEIKLRLAGVRRDELVEDITKCIHARSFEEARIKIALLRTIHPIFEPVAGRLESEARASEANVLLDRVVGLCGAKHGARDQIIEARRLFSSVQSLHEDPSILRPVEEALRALETRAGLESPASPRAGSGGVTRSRAAADRKPGGAARSPTGFALDPTDPEESTETEQDFR